MVNFMRLRHGSCSLLNPSTKRLAGFQSGAVVKNLPASVGDKREMGLIRASERSPGEENGNPLQEFLAWEIP